MVQTAWHRPGPWVRLDTTAGDTSAPFQELQLANCPAAKGSWSGVKGSGGTTRPPPLLHLSHPSSSHRNWMQAFAHVNPDNDRAAGQAGLQTYDSVQGTAPGNPHAQSSHPGTPARVISSGELWRTTHLILEVLSACQLPMHELDSPLIGSELELWDGSRRQGACRACRSSCNAQS